MDLQKRKLAVICFVLAAVLFLCAATPLKQGSVGDVVKTMQRKLKSWGYYAGNVDGVFGAKTKQAVIYFQKRNGLTADGVVGEATAKALGMTLDDNGNGSGAAQPGNTDNDLYLLAKCVYAEARGEPYEGKVAVAAVVLNRVRSPEFPNSIYGVIYQPLAFTAVADGQINLTPDDSAMRAARDAMNGWDPSSGCLYYYNPEKSTSKWILSRQVLLVIGQHHFAI